ncbi:hypothetical protein, partial [Polymorphospora sp. NPDC050346]|uniref:hypothetical protein n=1 Tax=Polymorphospora sp. NPDC050346 TaxID=3155780 RepID=UPI0033E94FCF
MEVGVPPPSSTYNDTPYPLWAVADQEVEQEKLPPTHPRGRRPERTRPALASVPIPAEEVGRNAVSLLMRKLAGT